MPVVYPSVQHFQFPQLRKRATGSCVQQHLTLDPGYPAGRSERETLGQTADQSLHQ